MEDQLWQAISPEAKESWLHRFKRWSFHGSHLGCRPFEGPFCFLRFCFGPDVIIIAQQK